MKLITELYDSDISSIIVEENDNKNLYIEGIFLQSEVKNRNGRVYPKSILEKAIKEYDSTFIKTNRAMGELNHPSGPSVNPERASHIITEITQKGNDFYGKAKILRTPVGNLVRTLIEDGVRMGVSSRGMGTIKESNGRNVVQNDFYLATVDIVSDPSAPSAFVNGIYENKEWIYNDGILKEVDVQEIKNIVEENVKKDKNITLAEAKAFKLFMDKITRV